jgi:hypothetical protein
LNLQIHALMSRKVYKCYALQHPGEIYRRSLAMRVSASLEQNLAFSY